jgi:hypothetical protein
LIINLIGSCVKDDISGCDVTNGYYKDYTSTAIPKCIPCSTGCKVCSSLPDIISKANTAAVASGATTIIGNTYYLFANKVNLYSLII